MSRLDSFIRRLEAQRACLDAAAARVRELPGPVLELGLGNGRTFDHLRQLLPGRDIHAFDRALAAHPDCVPATDRLILGELETTLAESRGRFLGQVALAHLDIGDGHAEESRRRAQALAPTLAELMRPGGVVVAEPALAVTGWRDVPLPAGVPDGRYHLYEAA